jgi:hypothetical protein
MEREFAYVLKSSIGDVATVQVRPWTIGSRLKKTFARPKNV